MKLNTRLSMLMALLALSFSLGGMAIKPADKDPKGQKPVAKKAPAKKAEPAAAKKAAPAKKDEKPKAEPAAAKKAAPAVDKDSAVLTPTITEEEAERIVVNAYANGDREIKASSRANALLIERKIREIDERRKPVFEFCSYSVDSKSTTKNGVTTTVETRTLNGESKTTKTVTDKYGNTRIIKPKGKKK